MSHKHLLDILWLLLIVLTISGAWLGESAQPGSGLALFLCLVAAFKGRMVIDHFMELRTANRHLRHLMRFYFYLFPLVTFLVYVTSASQ